MQVLKKYYESCGLSDKESDPPKITTALALREQLTGRDKTGQDLK
jgi:hypothetical protein